MKRPILRPLVPLYAAALKLSNAFRKTPATLQHPVISIGNLSTGGTGKTPLTIAIARLLSSEGMAVDVLSRGYGRETSTTEKVDPAGDAAQFGDEPILIARDANVPVFVSFSRFKAGQLAEQSTSNASTLHLLDDGFQHRRLTRHVDIVLINSEDLADSLLPAGNLREPLSALRRASAFAIDGDDDAAIQTLLALGFGPAAGQPIWRYRRELSIPAQLGLTPAAAFCGIARPAQFFVGLRESGVNLRAQHAFPDHHRFQATDLTLLQKTISSSGAQAFVTTAKDHIRLGTLRLQLESVAPLHVADLQFQVEDPSTLIRWIADCISNHHPAR